MLRSNRDVAKTILLPVKVSSRETNTILQKGSQTSDFADQRYLSFVNCRRLKGNPLYLTEVDSIQDKV